MFELLGSDDDHTRLLVSREAGYSIPVPGRPLLRPTPAGPPAYDVVVEMRDLPMELGFRIDRLPAGTDPQALVIALAQAYGTNRATEVPSVRPLRGSQLARGAAGGATCVYNVRPAADANPEARVMEQVEVHVRPHADRLHALYYTVRYLVPGVSPVQWGHFRAAVRGHQLWDPEQPVPAVPTLFPPSAFAAPNVTLSFTDHAWVEARAKAADLGQMSDDETTALLQALVEFSNNDTPPTLELPRLFVDLIPGRVRSIARPDIAEPLLRNFDEVKTVHDLRAWIWQCVWAIGNRSSRTN